MSSVQPLRDAAGRRRSPATTPGFRTRIAPANWGTMLQFVVARPPRTLEQAWTLALQQHLVARDTLTGPGVPFRDHARTLIARPTWFLHCRP